MSRIYEAAYAAGNAADNWSISFGANAAAYSAVHAANTANTDSSFYAGCAAGLAEETNLSNAVVEKRWQLLQILELA